MKYRLNDFDFATPTVGDYILYLDLNSSDEVDEFERKLAELRPSCLNASTIIKYNDKMFITFLTREKRREFFSEFVKRYNEAFVEPYYLEIQDEKDTNKSPCDMCQEFDCYGCEEKKNEED